MASLGASMRRGGDTVRTRTFLILLLLLTGTAPLLTFGIVAIDVSREATVSERRRANELLAQNSAERVRDHIRHEIESLLIAGTALRTSTPEMASHLAEGYLLDHPHWHNLTILEESGTVRTKVPASRYKRPAIDGKRALLGEQQFSVVRASEAKRDGPFAHSMSMALPLHIVGSLRGAVLVDLHLVNLWAPINATRLDERGFVRLLTAEGLVLAHGHPDDRRDVYAGQNRLDLLEKAKAGNDIVNSLGEPSIAVSAPVEGTNWYVIVEQPLSEAYATARAMRSRLLWLVGVTALIAILLGLWVSRGFVKDLESLEAHTHVLAKGNLDATLGLRPKIREIGGLATSIEEMATSLGHLHTAAQARERVTTFGRVAAGLAHDLRQPIETVQTACSGLLESPDDPMALDLFQWTVGNEMPRLRSYLDDLQHLANDGDLFLHPSTVQMEPLIQGVIESLAAAPKWTGVAFSWSGSAKDIDADEKLLARALFNLAANGADATIRRGGGNVSIEVSDVGSEIEIRLVDNGTGMSEAMLAKIMNGDFHSTKRVNGVGLGFGIARHIVESHGGQLTGETVEGVGTTFVCSIPRVSSETSK